MNNNAPENYFTEIWNTASGISEEFDMTIRKIGHVLGCGSENHAMRHLGTGEKYDEVATLALYCILQHPNSYLSAVKCASKASQNSAMITQLVGLLMGLKLGVHALPVVWVEHCQNRKYILKLTEKLNNHRIR